MRSGGQWFGGIGIAVKVLQVPMGAGPRITFWGGWSSELYGSGAISSSEREIWVFLIFGFCALLFDLGALKVNGWFIHNNLLPLRDIWEKIVISEKFATSASYFGGFDLTSPLRKIPLHTVPPLVFPTPTGRHA